MYRHYGMAWFVVLLLPTNMLLDLLCSIGKMLPFLLQDDRRLLVCDNQLYWFRENVPKQLVQRSNMGVSVCGIALLLECFFGAFNWPMDFYS